MYQDLKLRAAARQAPLTLLLLTELLLTAGCGGGGGSSGQPAAPANPVATNTGPGFKLIYPGGAGLTDASSVSIVGSASDAEGDAVASVSISVGGVTLAAAVDADGNWRADDVALAPGSNAISVTATDAEGATTTREVAEVVSSPVLAQPSSVVLNDGGDRLYVLDTTQLAVVDTATESLSILSSRVLGSGPYLQGARHMVRGIDGSLMVAELDRVIRIDSVTGDRELAVTLPTPTSIAVMAMDADQNLLYLISFADELFVADLDTPRPTTASSISGSPGGLFGSLSAMVDAVYVASRRVIYSVDVVRRSLTVHDIDTGEATRNLLELDPALGIGLPLFPVGIDYDATADRLLVIDAGGGIHEINPDDLTVVLLHSGPVSLLPVPLNGLALGVEELWTVAPGTSSVIRIELESGSRSTVFSSALGTGPPLTLPVAARYDSAAERLVVAANPRLIAIDPATGNRTQLADLLGPVFVVDPADLPTPPLLTAMALSADGERAWVTNLIASSVIEVDLSNGEFEDLASDEAGSGPLPERPTGLAVDAAATTLYVSDDGFQKRVLAIDVASGERRVLADVDFGGSLNRLRGLVLDAANDRLLLDLSSLTPLSVPAAIVALDLTSLEQQQVADLSSLSAAGTGAPVLLSFSAQMSLGADGNRLFYPVAGNPEVAYAAIDLRDGSITPLASDQGPSLLVPSAVEVTPGGRTFALDSSNAVFVLDQATGERVIISK